MAARPRRRRRHRAHRRHSRRAGKRMRALRALGFRMNPRRRRRRAHHHTRRLRNPRRSGGSAGAGLGSTRGIMRLGTGAAVGAIGAVGLDYLWQYASGYLPASLQTGYVGTLAKAGAAVLAGWGASKLVGRSTAIAAAGGALTVILYQLAHQMIAQSAPAAAIPATTTAATPSVAGLNAYMRPGIGWVSPGSTLRGLGRTAAYMPGTVSPPNMNRPGGSVSMSGLASAGGWS
jgi:hypothetical protein